MATTIQVTLSGPLFRKGSAPVRAAAQNAVRELVELGEQRLDQMLRPRPAGVYLSVSEAQKGKASTGNYRRNIHAVVKDLNGIITDGGVVYGPWLEGTSSRNQTTRFKGYQSFRRTAQYMQKHGKAILEKWAHKAAQEMGGA